MGRLLDLVEALEARRAPVDTMMADLQAGPQDRLVKMLNDWSTMDESAWSEANVQALYRDIADLFKAHPVEAGGWYQAWRREHPGARLA